MEFEFVCRVCGKRYDGSVWVWRCASCGSTLSLKLRELPKLRLESLTCRPFNMWRYREVLPVKTVASLGEGCTPLVTREYMGVRVLYKLEHLNPTGSFKDRGSAITIAKALELSLSKISEDSSGNAGLSMAAYASAFGLRARIFVPKDAPEGKKRVIVAVGGEVVECPSRADANRRAMESEREGFTYVGHLWNPLYVHGTKTVVYEVFEELRDLPDTILVPTSSGTLLLGIVEGVKELMTMGLVKSRPRVIAVQTSEVCPLKNHVKAYGSFEGSSRLADGIRVTNPPRLKEMVDALKEFNGAVIVVNDNDIAKALKELVKMGFVVEPTSATALAALKYAIDYRIVDRGESVLLPLTGSGLKMLDKIVSVVSSR